MMSLLFRKVAWLVRDDRGADLIEYGLIGSIIAVAGVLVFPQIGTKLGAAFQAWGTNVYDAWEPPPPQ